MSQRLLRSVIRVAARARSCSAPTRQDARRVQSQRWPCSGKPTSGKEIRQLREPQLGVVQRRFQRISLEPASPQSRVDTTLNMRATLSVSGGYTLQVPRKPTTATAPQKFSPVALANCSFILLVSEAELKRSFRLPLENVTQSRVFSPDSSWLCI